MYIKKKTDLCLTIQSVPRSKHTSIS